MVPKHQCDRLRLGILQDQSRQLSGFRRGAASGRSSSCSSGLQQLRRPAPAALRKHGVYLSAQALDAARPKVTMFFFRPARDGTRFHRAR